jgi:hypothetical protein
MVYILGLRVSEREIGAIQISTLRPNCYKRTEIKFVGTFYIALIGTSMVRALGPYWLPNSYSIKDISKLSHSLSRVATSKSSATSQCAFKFLVATRKKGLHVFFPLNAENGFLKFKSKD